MKSFLKIKDFSVSQEAFELKHDEHLDMLITHPQPENLDAYYESEDYISHTDASKTFVDKIYQWVKRFSISRKLRLIDRLYEKNKTLLDVGAGTGDFLRAAKNQNWQTVGVEPNHEARKRALEKSVPLLGNLELLSGQKFGVITLWHVLEHLPNLEDQISKLAQLLEEQGTLIIAVPNFKSYDATYYKEFWAAYDVPRHLWHFSKTAIEKLFAAQGLKVVQTKPMIFDAFYVALLSEKYKTGKQQLFKAGVVGLTSNLKAWSNKEYSSHIYVLKKG